MGETRSWPVDWEGHGRAQIDAWARLDPATRLEWLESTKLWVIESWQARAALEPAFAAWLRDNDPFGPQRRP